MRGGGGGGGSGGSRKRGGERWVGGEVERSEGAWRGEEWGGGGD